MYFQARAQHCGNSSSDDNRSSGHASMSDTGNSSPRGHSSSGMDRLTAGVMQKPLRNRSSSQHNRSRHRATPARVLYHIFLLLISILTYLFPVTCTMDWKRRFGRY